MPVSPVVRITRSHGTPVGNLMNDIRSWLDSKKIEPVEFKSTVSEQELEFSIHFQDEEQANLFRRAFA